MQEKQFELLEELSTSLFQHNLGNQNNKKSCQNARMYILYISMIYIVYKGEKIYIFAQLVKTKDEEYGYCSPYQLTFNFK